MADFLVEEFSLFSFFRCVLCICIFAFFCVKAKAQEDNPHHNVGLTAALTSGDTWQLEASYHWLPVPYVGIGSGIGFWKQFSSACVPSGKYWKVNEDYQELSDLYFHPSILLISPTIIKKEDFSVHMTAETGLIMNIPYDKACIDICKDEYYIPYEQKYISNKRGNWCFYDIRVGIAIKIDPLMITVGYIFSNLDVFAMRRNMKYDNTLLGYFYPKAEKIHGSYVTISFAF